MIILLMMKIESLLYISTNVQLTSARRVTQYPKNELKLVKISEKSEYHGSEKTSLIWKQYIYLLLVDTT